MPQTDGFDGQETTRIEIKLLAIHGFRKSFLIKKWVSMNFENRDPKAICGISDTDVPQSIQDELQCLAPRMNRGVGELDHHQYMAMGAYSNERTDFKNGK